MFDTISENETGDEDTLGGGSVIAYDDLVFACTHMCDLLEIENEALASHDPETVKVLAENKAALAKLYERAVQPLVDHPELAEALEPEQREALAAIGLRLHELMTVNSRRLRAEMEAYQRVMDIIVQTAKANATSNTNYGRAGTFDSTGGPGAALSFNKSL